MSFPYRFNFDQSNFSHFNHMYIRSKDVDQESLTRTRSLNIMDSDGAAPSVSQKSPQKNLPAHFSGEYEKFWSRTNDTSQSRNAHYFERDGSIKAGKWLSNPCLSTQVMRNFDQEEIKVIKEMGLAFYVGYYDKNKVFQKALFSKSFIELHFKVKDIASIKQTSEEEGQLDELILPDNHPYVDYFPQLFYLCEILLKKPQESFKELMLSDREVMDLVELSLNDGKDEFFLFTFAEKFGLKKIKDYIKSYDPYLNPYFVQFSLDIMLKEFLFRFIRALKEQPDLIPHLSDASAEMLQPFLSNPRISFDGENQIKIMKGKIEDFQIISNLIKKFGDSFPQFELTIEDSEISEIPENILQHVGNLRIVSSRVGTLIRAPLATSIEITHCDDVEEIDAKNTMNLKCEYCANLERIYIASERCYIKECPKLFDNMLKESFCAMMKILKEDPDLIPQISKEMLTPCLSNPNILFEEDNWIKIINGEIEDFQIFSMLIEQLNKKFDYLFPKIKLTIENSETTGIPETILSGVESLRIISSRVGTSIYARFVDSIEIINCDLENLYAVNTKELTCKHCSNLKNISAEKAWGCDIEDCPNIFVIGMDFIDYSFITDTLNINSNLHQKNQALYVVRTHSSDQKKYNATVQRSGKTYNVSMNVFDEQMYRTICKLINKCDDIKEWRSQFITSLSIHSGVENIPIRFLKQLQKLKVEKLGENLGGICISGSTWLDDPTLFTWLIRKWKDCNQEAFKEVEQDVAYVKYRDQQGVDQSLIYSKEFINIYLSWLKNPYDPSASSNEFFLSSSNSALLLDIYDKEFTYPNEKLLARLSNIIVPDSASEESYSVHPMPQQQTYNPSMDPLNQQFHVQQQASVQQEQQMFGSLDNGINWKIESNDYGISIHFSHEMSNSKGLFKLREVDGRRALLISQKDASMLPWIPSLIPLFKSRRFSIDEVIQNFESPGWEYTNWRYSIDSLTLKYGKGHINYTHDKVSSLLGAKVLYLEEAINVTVHDDAHLEWIIAPLAMEFDISNLPKLKYIVVRDDAKGSVFSNKRMNLEQYQQYCQQVMPQQSHVQQQQAMVMQSQALDVSKSFLQKMCEGIQQEIYNFRGEYINLLEHIKKQIINIPKSSGPQDNSQVSDQDLWVNKIDQEIKVFQESFDIQQRSFSSMVIGQDLYDEMLKYHSHLLKDLFALQIKFRENNLILSRLPGNYQVPYQSMQQQQANNPSVNSINQQSQIKQPQNVTMQSQILNADMRKCEIKQQEIDNLRQELIKLVKHRNAKINYILLLSKSVFIPDQQMKQLENSLRRFANLDAEFINQQSLIDSEIALEKRYDKMQTCYNDMLWNRNVLQAEVQEYESLWKKLCPQ